MRPRLLEIEGLQSFRDRQKIDFESLGETGLFGIFGPTGSGKSTVLDAITFALYGRVKRAERGTQGIININMETAKVSFAFELFRDGIRKKYRVERTYQRKKGSDNSCEPKIARLIEITEEGEIPVCDKASEVSSSIEELIGLSHDDFTRAVVLPQNSFQEFLMLDSSKKRDMLERIFYLDEYGKNLWDKLNRKTAGLKSKIDILSGELTGYADATAEALDAARSSFETAVTERERVEKELKLLEIKFDESRELWQLVCELAVVEDREKQQTIHQEDMAGKRMTLEGAIKADNMIEIVRKNRELSLKLEDTKKQLNELLEALPEISGNLAAARQKYSKIKDEASTEQPKLVERRARFSEALTIKSEITVIQNKLTDLLTLSGKLKNEVLHKNNIIKQEENELEAMEQHLSELHLEIDTIKTLPEYRQKLQEGSKLEMEVESAGRNVIESKSKAQEIKGIVLKLEHKANDLKEHLIISQNVLDGLEIEIQKHETLKPEDRGSILKSRDELNKLQSICNILQFRKEETDSLNSKIEMLLPKQKELVQRIVNIKEMKASAVELFESCRAELELAKHEMDGNAAHMLSISLVEGEPCPVCGSEHHPNPASKGNDKDIMELERQVKAAKDQFANAEQALKEAEMAVLAAEEQLRSGEAELESVKKDLQRKISEYDNQKLSLPEKLRGLEPEKLHWELERLDADSVVRLGALDAWEKKLEEYKSEVQKLKNKLAEDKLVEKGIYTELKVTAANSDQIEKILLEMNNSFINKQHCYNEFLQLYKIESPVSELNRIMEKDRKSELLQKEAEKTRESIALKRIQLEKGKEELGILVKNDIKSEADTKNLEEQKTGKETKLKELVGDADIEGEIGDISSQLEGYIILEKQYQEELGNLEKKYNELVTRKSTLENQYDIYSGDYLNEEARIKSALVEKGFSTIDEVEMCIISKETQRDLLTAINENEKVWTNIQAQKGILTKRLDFRSITEEDWNSISSEFQQLAALKEESVSLCEVARSSLNNIKSKHEKWMELNNKYMKLTKQYGLLDTIGRLLRADRGKDNSFIDYIAEERLAYVAAKASEILGSITGYKYALELDTNAGFIIRDNANGGVHRMVTSLSGGETFLTSLSLALALSEQIQLKGQSPLEFFFLDEGFGTLDAGLLDTVIDSLERLSCKERVIGLISHVPELKGRMARRLIVDPPSMQGDGSRVRIEKA